MSGEGLPRLELKDARKLAQELVDLLRPHCARIEIAGSIRREKASIGDLELVAQPAGELLTRADELLAEGVFAKRHAWGDRAKFGTYKGVPFDLFVSLSDRQFACTYWLRTGSADANRLLVTQWHKGGILPDTVTFCAEQFWQLPEPLYALPAEDLERCKNRGDLSPLGGIVLPMEREEDIFALVDLPFIPPRFRDENTYRMLAGRKLVSFRDVQHLWDKAKQRFLIPELFYIGRAMSNVGAPASAWSNPFKISTDTPEERAAAIAQYRTHVEEFLGAGKLKLDALRGKVLVCWCADHDNPKPCHGDVLLELMQMDSTAHLRVETAQLPMFSSAKMREWEFQSAARAMEVEVKSTKSKPVERFDWSGVWLGAGDQVWVSVGYGNFELHPVDSVRALSYLDYLRSLDALARDAHQRNLTMFLLRQARAVAAPVPAAPLEHLKALSLWNPWAVFVMRGLKQFETRHWKTSYRGKLVIHAAKKWTADEKEWLQHFVDELRLDTSPNSPYWSLMHEKRYFGVALGTVDLVDIVPTEGLKVSRTERLLGNYAYGRYAWKLENPQPFEQPIPCSGHQSLWDWKVA